MFGKIDTTSNKNGSVNTAELEVCNIAKGTTIEGNFKAQSNIRLEGIIEGDVQCLGRIVLSEQAQIKGHVHCHTILCKGHVTGNVVAKDTIHLHATAVVHGDIAYQKLQIDEGAIFNGKATCSKSATAASAPKKSGKEA